LVAEGLYLENNFYLPLRRYENLKTILGGLLLGSLWTQQGAFRIGTALLPQSSFLLNADDAKAGSKVIGRPLTLGFAGGLSASYHFTDNLSVGLDEGQRYQGVSYIRGELSIDEDTTYFNIPLDYTARTTLNYLKVPAYFYFNTDPNAKVFFTAFLGPQVNLLISYKERLDGTVETGFFGSIPFSVTASGKTIRGEAQLDEESKVEGEVHEAPLPKLFVWVSRGAGIGISLTDNLLLSLSLRADYTLGDAENKEAKVEGTDSDGEPFSYKFWSRQHKYDPSGGLALLSGEAPPDYKRAPTRTMTVGLQIGIYYVIGR
jgi:hypothetical protein